MRQDKTVSPGDNPFSFGSSPATFLFPGKRLYSEIFSGLMKYNVETLKFLNKRFEQDMKLVEDLASASEFDEAVCCYLDFMRQAQIDYSDEMARFFRISATVAADTAEKVEREARNVTEEFAAATAA